MFYLYLGRNELKALCLKKSFLGQYSSAYFQRTHSVDLKADGTIKSIDLIASAIKEALTAISAPKKEDKVTLILPLELFEFLRIEVPKDINDTALSSFIEDKIRSDLSLDPELFSYQYLSFKKDTTTIINLYLIKKSLLQHYLKIFDLLVIKLVNVIPETASYYKLFEKTLRTAKQENIFYLRIEDNHQLRGFLFDSFGLVKKDVWFIDGYEEANLEEILREKVFQFSKEGIKIDRLILSGSRSNKIRQDTFTKNIGAWTNLLKRIIPDFYQKYLKLLVTNNNPSFPFLNFDQSFGAFILEKEDPYFKIKVKPVKTKISHYSSPKKIPLKKIGLFIVSFGLSFGLLYLIASHKTSFLKQPLPPPTPTSAPAVQTPTPLPTPKIERKKVKIEVLNGSGIKGQAARMKKILTDLGYQEVVTKNADNFDYQKTIIITAKEKAYMADFVKNDLKNQLKDIQIKNEAPKTADVILIIGKDFK